MVAWIAPEGGFVFVPRHRYREFSLAHYCRDLLSSATLIATIFAE
jgi:hypothetical protein